MTVNGFGKPHSAVYLFCTNVPIHPNVFQHFEVIGTENEGVITRQEVGLRNKVKHTNLFYV